jgi:GNAT superfamily N-acetyltransferase
MTSPLVIEPLTPERWRDLVRLFGERGASAGCWCMWWRQSGAEFRKSAGAKNKRAFKEIVDTGRATGLLAYLDGRPAGWCSVAPRQDFPRLQRSPDLKPVDDRRVWSVVCFFIERRARGRGVAAALLEAAIDHARRNGARIVEGYPVDGPDAWGAASAYTGLTSMFRRAGFRQVARRPGARRRVMRYSVRGARPLSR